MLVVIDRTDQPIFFRGEDGAIWQYSRGGKWVGVGSEDCTDPKLLRKAITEKPEEIFSEVSIYTFLGGSFDFQKDSFDSLWKPIDFVYNPVSFNRYYPIVSVCYELNVPKGLQTKGIQFIDMKMRRGGFYDFVKISPPGYLHQNIDIRPRQIVFLNDVTFELDYQVDNVLKVGDDNCHPDPSFDRDECVIKQLLNVRCYWCI